MTNGYHFYFAAKNIEDSESLTKSDIVLTFPITPSKLNIKVGSKNKTVNLINDGEINLLKSPSLAEVEFEARFPMREYPYAVKPKSFQYYYKKFKSLKAKRKPFRFIVVRTTPNGKRTWDTNILVSLEEFEIVEDADNGDDVLVNFKLKEYKTFGIIQLDDASLPKKKRDTDGKSDGSQKYKIQDGDTLTTISKKFYGDGSYGSTIYQANKEIIEADAKVHGRHSSANGQYLYVGLEVIIPPKPVKSSTGSGRSTVTTAPSEPTPTPTAQEPDYKPITLGTYRLDVTIKQRSETSENQLFVRLIFMNGGVKRYSGKTTKSASYFIDKGTQCEILIGGLKSSDGAKISHKSGVFTRGATDKDWVFTAVQDSAMTVEWSQSLVSNAFDKIMNFNPNDYKNENTEKWVELPNGGRIPLEYYTEFD